MQPTAMGISTCSPEITAGVSYCIMAALAMCTETLLEIACNAVMQSQLWTKHMHAKLQHPASKPTAPVCCLRGRLEEVTSTASSPVLAKSCWGSTITRGSRELYALMLSSSSWQTKTCRATSALLTWQQDCHLWLTNQWLDSSTCKKQHVC